MQSSFIARADRQARRISNDKVRSHHCGWDGHVHSTFRASHGILEWALSIFKFGPEQRANIIMDQQKVDIFVGRLQPALTIPKGELPPVASMW